MLLTDFGDVLGARMRAEHEALAQRWFERLLDLLPVGAREIFPTDSLLDHIPALIREISRYLLTPDALAIAANTAIIEKAQELGALRYSQQASLHQILREYQILKGVLVTFVLEELARSGATAAPDEPVLLTMRVHQAVDILSQATVETFVRLYTETIAKQREALEQFTRMAAHEWRQPLGALQFAVALLGGAAVDEQQSRRALSVLERNVTRLVALTHKLESIARLRHNADNAIVQTVSSGTVAEEAARQLRDMADAHGVEVRIAENLPPLRIDVGRLEMIFLNLMSNAIKYSDPAKSPRYVQVAAAPAPDGWVALEVSDNGVGIPAEALNGVFERFTRAHANREELTHVSGIGLGLSIVEECAQALGGHVQVSSEEGVGTTFRIRLPRGDSPAIDGI